MLNEVFLYTSFSVSNHINLSDDFIYRASVATKESRENKSID
jgi:hypothetical protein